MLPFNIQPGDLVIGSSRYNNKPMTEDDLRDFWDRAGIGRRSERPPDSRRRPDPPRIIELQPQPDSQACDLSEVCTASTARLHSSDVLAPRQLPTSPYSVRARRSSRFSSRKARPARQPSSNVSTGGPSGTSLSATPRYTDQVKENIFCNHCQLFVDKSRIVQMRPGEKGENIIETFPHYDNIEALEKSALEGCHLCSLLASPDPTTSIVSPLEKSKPYSLRVKCTQSYDGPGRLEMEVPGYPVKTTYISYDGPLFKIQGSLRYRRTDADEVLELAKSWLDTCTNDHENCRHSSLRDDFVPTRLLKIRTNGRFLLSVQICLSNTEDFKPRTPYLALSHCWGATSVLQLTTATSATFPRDVPLSSLPQTFSDAALITARLGYEYLWIDSLCIIQDSPDGDDWTREAATMGNVYSGAALTIAALGAAKSDDGCFVTRNPLAFTPCLLRDGEGRDCVWAENQRVQRPDSEGEMRSPLHRRAWVVQERALALRTLHFGSDMVFWECVEGTASEERPVMKSTVYGQFGERSDNLTLAWQMGLKTALHTIKEFCQSGDWADWECFWWRMVREYTSGKLTFDRDKWTAFSGLAKVVEQHTRTRLYHGLWESNIFDELLWRVPKPGRRVNFDTPSWSWLSIDVGVHEQRYNYDRDFRQVATVSIPQTNQTSTNIFHQSKKLCVRGRLLRLKSRVGHFGSGKKDYKFKLHDGRQNHEQYSDGRWNPDVVPDESWELSALQFVTTEWNESYGLVVRPIDASKTAWLRVGYYAMSWRQEDDEDENTPQRYLGDYDTITLT